VPAAARGGGYRLDDGRAESEHHRHDERWCQQADERQAAATLGFHS
jgi:hypothetical protein